MKKMFISLLLLYISILTKPSGSLDKASDILPNISPEQVIAIDFKSRLKLAEEEFQNSKAAILKEVGVPEFVFNDFIKKTLIFIINTLSRALPSSKQKINFLS